MTRTQNIAFGAFAVIALVGMSFYSLGDISSDSIRLHLRLLGSSIYEYHDQTGRWPTRSEDLAQTSLPVRSPHWKVMLDSGTNVVIWHRDLKSNPRENANVMLAYHNKGLLAWMGRQWVCWGDLRTEYIRSRDLRAKLQTRVSEWNQSPAAAHAAMHSSQKARKPSHLI